MANIRLTPEEEEWRDRVRDGWKSSDDNLRQWREQCNEDYRQFRNVQRHRAHARQNPPDRDAVAADLIDEYGHDLHIPIAYSTIETELPRIVANRPRGLVLPNEQTADDNVENMRLLVDTQQDAMHFELLSQDVVKSGLLYGLGILKGPYWKRVVQPGVPVLQRATDAQAIGADWVVASTTRTVFDDPWGCWVDIFDAAWDRFGYNADTLRWFSERMWVDGEYVAAQLGIAQGAELPDRSLAPWNTACAQQITPEDLKGMATGQRKMNDGVWKDRMVTAGQIDTPNDQEAGDLHEVVEFWSNKGDRIVVLDEDYVVSIGRNGFWHSQIPYHFYRPQTAGIKQLHGISEIEPLSDLIRELDLLRNMRRKNAMLTLQRVMIFDEDAVNRDDLVYGPGVAIPVQSDDPRQHLYALDQPGIPYSGYREEDSLKSDIDRTSGVSDTVMGAEGGGAAQTATGAQLITAAANARLENKSRRFEAETVTPFTNQQIALDQQMVIEKQIRVPSEPQPGQIDPQPWRWLTLTPAELAGSMSYAFDSGSMAPKNIAQDMQQAQYLWAQFRGDPSVDQNRLRKQVLESNGAKNASSWILPQPTPDPNYVAALERMVGPQRAQQLQAMLSQGGAQGGQ